MLKLGKYLSMQNLSRRKVAPKRPKISPDNVGAYNIQYQAHLNYVINYNKELINAILEPVGGRLVMPMDTGLIETYLSGFRVSFKPFEPEADVKLDGCWKFETGSFTSITVYYNSAMPAERQRFTKVHELLLRWTPPVRQTVKTLFTVR